MFFFPKKISKRPAVNQGEKKNPPRSPSQGIGRLIDYLVELENFSSLVLSSACPTNSAMPMAVMAKLKLELMAPTWLGCWFMPTTESCSRLWERKECGVCGLALARQATAESVRRYVLMLVPRRRTGKQAKMSSRQSAKL